jgi:hypothetical protein
MPMEMLELLDLLFHPINLPDMNKIQEVEQG